MTAHCATCTCRDDAPHQPATSTDSHRRAVIRGALDLAASKKRARETVNDVCGCGHDVTDHGIDTGCICCPCAAYAAKHNVNEEQG